jgi:hypothetical protein
MTSAQSEHFDDATAVEFKDAVAKKIEPPTTNKRQSTLPSQPGSSGGTIKSLHARR